MKHSAWLLSGGLGLLFCGVPRPADAAITDLIDKIQNYVAVSGKMPPAPGTIGKVTPQRLVLNGQALRLMIGRTKSTQKEVLDYYQNEYPGGLLKEAAGGPAVIRSEWPDHGHIITADVQDKRAVAEIKEVKRTLTSSGPLRMVVTRQTASSTDYIVVHSDKPLDDKALEPPPGRDAPGEDMPDVPRPIGGVRGLSVRDPGSGYFLVQYKVPAQKDAALAAAASQVRSSGYQEDLAFANATQQTGDAVRHFQRGSVGLMMFARDLTSASGSQLTYVTRRE